MDRILLTGGFGYVGSHTAALLAEKGKDFLIYDNFCNCNSDIVYRLEKTIGKKIYFVEGDVRDTTKIEKIIRDNKISSVLHFAALKYVEDSVNNPLEYYDVNVSGTISLLKAMQKNNVKKFLFSSSATIYGEPKYLPIDEIHPLNAINPYGETKLIVEKMLEDLSKSDGEWSIISLRYFNPIGSHQSGLIGDDPFSEKSKNLLPSIIRTALGLSKEIKIYGNDYDTKDGTGIRDYIHILDLANAHLKALENLNKNKGIHVFNLGTGKGFSVLELVNTFESVTGTHLPKQIIKKREGDVSSCYANPSKSKNILNWQTNLDLKEMCLSAWKFSNKKD